jgi:hypothetical protein
LRDAAELSCSSAVNVGRWRNPFLAGLQIWAVSMFCAPAAPQIASIGLISNVAISEVRSIVIIAGGSLTTASGSLNTAGKLIEVDAQSSRT